MRIQYRPPSPVFSIFLAIASIVLPCAAMDQPICPPSIPAESVTVQPISAQWSAFTPGPLTLSGAGFMQGPPATLSDLKPYSTVETKNSLTSTWKFDGPYAQGKWLSCDYAGGATSLARRIADATNECSVTYEKRAKSTYRFVAIHCK